DELGLAVEGGADLVEEILGAQLLRRPGRIEDPGGALLDHADGPFGKVTGVDELHRVTSVARQQHFPALGNAPRPVGETIGFVAWTDDVAGSDHRHLTGEPALRLGLAGRLERSVQPADVGDKAFPGFLQRILAGVLREWRIFRHAGPGGIAINRDGRDEYVLAHLALQHLAGIAYPVRHAGRVVDAD